MDQNWSKIKCVFSCNYLTMLFVFSFSPGMRDSQSSSFWTSRLYQRPPCLPPPHIRLRSKYISKSITSIKVYQISTVLLNLMIYFKLFFNIWFHIHFKQPWNTEFCLPLMPLAAPASFWRRHEDLLQHRCPPRLERKTEQVDMSQLGKNG